MAKINSLSDSSLEKLQRDLQQVRNDTVNLRRHLAHVSARHREAVWMPGDGLDVLNYREGFLAGGYSGDLYKYWPDVSGGGYSPCLAFTQYIGNSTVGWDHNSGETNPYTNGNFTITKNGVYLVWLTIRVLPKIDSIPTGRETVSYGIAPYRKRSGSWDLVHRGCDFAWYLDWTDGDTTVTASSFTTITASMTMPLKKDDKITFRTQIFQRTNSNIRAELSDASMQVTRIDDAEKDWIDF